MRPGALLRTCLKRNGSIATPLSAPFPNLLRVLGSFPGGSIPNHGNRVTYAHLIRHPFRAHYRDHPLPERTRALSSRVVLHGSPSEPRFLESYAFPGVAAPAGPHLVFRGVVFFMPVDVLHFHVSFRAAHGTDLRAGRRLLIRPVTQGPV